MTAILATILTAMLTKVGFSLLKIWIIMHVVLLTSKFLFKKLKEIICKAGKRVFVGKLDKLINAVDKKGKTVNINDLKSEIGEEGVILAEVSEDDEVDEDSIKIIKADKMDESLKGKLQDEGIVLYA